MQKEFVYKSAAACYNVVMELPKDPAMLYSYLNTLLRDECDGLSSLCERLDLDPETFSDALSAAGLFYDAAQKRVIFK